MKKNLQVIGLVVAALFIFAGNSKAVTITYLDTAVTWGGYEQYASYGDEIGVPKITSMSVTIDDITGYLQSVVINMYGRQAPDYLFINNVSANQNWTYYIYDTSNSSNGQTAALYTVGSDFTYIYATEGRIGHPAGIDSGITSDTAGLLNSVIYDGESLIYLFNEGLIMGDEFLIAYAPYCANDVIITPEPSILILLGIGLLGLAGVRRRLSK